MFRRRHSTIGKDLKHKRKDFVYCTRRLRLLLFIWGVLPVYEDNKNQIRFSWKNWRMLYTVVLFSISVFLMTRYAFYYRVLGLVEHFEDFDRTINNIMFLSFANTQYSFPIGGWLAARAIADYHNQWMSFDKRYTKKIKDELVMTSFEPLVNKLIFIYLFLSFILLYGQLFLLPTYTFAESLGYIPTCNIYFGYIGLIHIHCSGIKKVSHQLIQKLNEALTRKVVTRDMIVTFKYLWVNLSNITQQIGHVFFNFSIIMLFGTYFNLLVLNYGYFSLLFLRLKENESDVLITSSELGLLVSMSSQIILLFHTCNCTYLASKKLEEEFVDVLSEATTKPHHPEVIKEIDSFLSAIQHNPPDVILIGSTKMNRRFISATFSTLCTYLVVLIQFKIGLDHMRRLRS